MSVFANHSTASKLSKTVPSPNPSFTKLAGAWHTSSVGKVEDFAHGSNLHSLVGVGIGKVFDLDVSWRFQSPANFVKLGLVKGTVFDSAHDSDRLGTDAIASHSIFYSRRFTDSAILFLTKAEMNNIN